MGHFKVTKEEVEDKIVYKNLNSMGNSLSWNASMKPLKKISDEEKLKKMKDKDPIDIDSHCTEPVPKEGKQLVFLFFYQIKLFQKLLKWWMMHRKLQALL